MEVLSDWYRWLGIAGATLDLSLFVKLYATGLGRTYKWFGRLLLCDALVTVLLVAAMQSRREYTVIWLWSQPVYWVLSFAVLLEIYSLVMGRYPRVCGLLRWTLLFAAGSCLFVTYVYALKPDDPQHLFGYLRAFLPTHRAVVAIVAIAMLTPWLFLARFPVKLARNAVTHTILFSLLAAIEVANVLMPPSMTALATGAADLCLLGWILLLNPKGERMEIVVGPARSEEATLRLLSRLMDLEQALSRFG